MQSKIIATMLGLAAEIEREFISIRTKEALQARKTKGIKLGKPKSEALRLKLDDKRYRVEQYIGMRLGLRETAKLINKAPSTLRDYLKRREIDYLNR